MRSIGMAALAATLAAMPAAAADRAAPPRAAQARPSPAAAPPATAPPVAAVPSAALAGDAAPPRWRMGPGLGLEYGMGDLRYSAPKVRIEAERAVRRLSPFTTVSFVGALSAVHASGEETLPVVIPAFPFPIVRQAAIEWDANVIEAVPAARVTYAASRALSFFADGGVGLVYTAARVHLPPVASGLPEEQVLSGGLGGVVRLAAGVVITPSPALRIGVEAVGLNLRLGDGLGTGFSLGVSLAHPL